MRGCMIGQGVRLFIDMIAVAALLSMLQRKTLQRKRTGRRRWRDANLRQRLHPRSRPSSGDDGRSFSVKASCRPQW